jgi:hypothetical protein
VGKHQSKEVYFHPKSGTTFLEKLFLGQRPFFIINVHKLITMKDTGYNARYYRAEKWHTTADKMNSCFCAGSPQNTAGVNPAKHVRAAPRTYNKQYFAAELVRQKEENKAKDWKDLYLHLRSTNRITRTALAATDGTICTSYTIHELHRFRKIKHQHCELLFIRIINNQGQKCMLICFC